MGRRPKLNVGAPPQVCPLLEAPKVEAPKVNVHRIEPEEESGQPVNKPMLPMPPTIQAALDALTAEGIVQDVADAIPHGPDGPPPSNAHHRIVRIIVAKDAADTQVILEDGSALMGLTKIATGAAVKELATFTICGVIA
jgi:hypothetical protein